MFSQDSLSQPADSYRRMSEYQRSSDNTGTDLFFDSQSDLSNTSTGDLVQITGADLITQSVIRRLHTPTFGFGRWVRTSEGLEIIDSEYGNRAYEYLSGPLSPTVVSSIRTAIIDCLSKESRIEVLEVKTKQSEFFNDVNVEVTYRLLSDSQLRTLSSVLTRNQNVAA